MRIAVAITAAACLAACGPDESTPYEPPVSCPGAGDYEFADVIVDAPGEVESPYAVNEPENAINGIVEGEPKTGGTDVFSRGVSTDPPNNYVVLRWSNRRVVDSDGPDFVVFENAFETQGGVFMDPIVVSVSDDGEEWFTFPHDYTNENESTYSRDPSYWQGFAGVTPVRWTTEEPECSDPIAPASGGDRFDLADLPNVDGFRFVRLTAAPTVENPDTGEPFPRDFLSDGFDLDGVYAASTEVD